MSKARPGPSEADNARPEYVRVQFNRGSWTDPMIIVGDTSRQGSLALALEAVATRLHEPAKSEVEAIARRILRGPPVEAGE